MDPAPTAPPQPSEAAGPTLPMVDQSGQIVQVPHERVHQAFASGKLGFVRGQDVPVVGSDGTVGHVAPEHAAAVLAQPGARIATPEETHKAQLEAKYGGLGGAVAATAEGGARGVSLGISDPLAAFAGKVIGGEKGEQAVRQHLLDVKETRPWLSTGAELLGAGIPIIASGGAAAPEEAAQLGARAAVGAADEAGVIASIGKGVRTLGALPRSVSYLGDAAEHAVSGLLGASDTVIGGAAKAAARAATRGIVEGGLFGAGQEVSESSLENQPLTAEKLYASVKHGALMGGLLGTGLGAAGSFAEDIAGNVIGKLAPGLDDAAGEQTWKWMNPGKKLSEEAAKRGGGTDAVGRTVFDEVLRPLVEEKGLTGAAISNEEKLELVQQALQRKGGEISDHLAGSKATVPLEDMTRPIQERIDEFSGRVGGEDKVAALQKLKASVERVLGGPEAEPIEQRLKGLIPGSPEHEAELAKAGYVRRTGPEIAEHIRANPDLLKEPTLPLSATHVAPVLPESTGMVSIADAIRQRRSLQQLAFEESKSLDPNMRVQLLRDISGEWNALEEKALNKASAAEGGQAGTQFRELNKTYQQLKIAEKALETNVARYATNNTFGLGAQLFGASHVAGAIASGHPATALGAPLVMAGHKALMAHGNAYAALMLDRLATFGGVSRAVADVDEELQSSVTKALNGKTIRLPRAFHVDTSDYEEHESHVRQLAAMSPGLVGAHLADRTAPLTTHMPQTSAQIQQMAKAQNAYLVSKLPPSPLGQPSLTPQLDKPTTTEAQKQTFLRAKAAIDGGPEEIMKRFAAGKSTPEDMEVLQKFYPHLFGELKTTVATKCADRKKPVAFQRQIQISQQFNMPTNPLLENNAKLVIQSSYAKHPGAGSQAPAMPRRAPQNPSISKSLEGEFEHAQHGGR